MNTTSGKEETAAMDDDDEEMPVALPVYTDDNNCALTLRCVRVNMLHSNNMRINHTINTRLCVRVFVNDNIVHHVRMFYYLTLHL